MPDQARGIGRQIAVIAALLVVYIVNALSGALPINGLSMAELAARYDVLFEPAGYAFSIWGLIYLGLAAYAIYQARPAVRADPRLRSLDLPFVISAVANVGWLLLWHYEQVVASFVAMLVLWFSLVAIYRRLGPEQPFIAASRRWAVHHPFSVYLGWVTVASVVNLAITLDHLGWSGWGLPPVAWFVVAVAGVVAIAGIVAWRRGDVPLLLTLIWALVAVAIAREDQPIAAAAAWVAVGLIAIMVALAGVKAPA